MRCDNILSFFEEVRFEGSLPQGISMMNPYAESAEVRQLCHLFYRKFYNDNHPRYLILGINPGRLGAGATGIPFTDTKRLQSECGIAVEGQVTHEPSSVFMYDMIRTFGGPEVFFRNFYINSICPLGFIRQKGKSVVNYNYYDDPALESCVREFILTNIRTQIQLAGRTEVCFCLGTGKNYKYLHRLNEEHRFFGSVIPLEHPRYIMQYKLKGKDQYIDDYVAKLSSVLN